MANWVIVDPKRGIYIDMDLVGAIGTYEQKHADGDNWCVCFSSREDVENEIACGRFPTKEAALNCARVGFITASLSQPRPVYEFTTEEPLVKEFDNGETEESSSGTVRG